MIGLALCLPQIRFSCVPLFLGEYQYGYLPENVLTLTDFAEASNVGVINNSADFAEIW